MTEQLHQRFSPYADKRWYLITSLDDYSRLSLSLDARLVEKETGTAEVRIWYKDILTDVYQAKKSDLDLVRF